MRTHPANKRPPSSDYWRCPIPNSPATFWGAGSPATPSCGVSSPTFEVLLRPDPRLRGLLLATCGFLCPRALGVLAAASLDAGLRLILAAAWLADAAATLTHLAAGQRRVAAIGIDSSGAIRVFDPHGGSRPAILLSGSRMGRRLAWLRLRIGSGRPHVELLSDDGISGPDWRRLRLLWRLAAGRFAAPAARGPERRKARAAGPGLLPSAASGPADATR